MKDKLKKILNSLNSREKMLALTCALIVSAFLVPGLLKPVLAAFKEQESEYKKSQEKLDLLPEQLERYLLLSKQKEKIEESYKSVKFPDGVLSHIEELIRKFAKVETSTDYKINPLAPKEFGGDYEQVPFRIELFTTSLENLSIFLDELVRGKQPLALTSLNIKKTRRGNKLTVILNVSHFREIEV